MKRILYLGVVLALFLGQTLFAAGGKQDSNQVVIYSTSEDYRIEYFQKRLNEQFLDYKILINYMPTGNLAAKLKAEGTRTECDIIGELDAAYLEGLADNLADLSSYDTSVFLDELVPAHHRYLPFGKGSGCIAVNEAFLTARNLPIPASYDDLLKPVYKGLISMPNPKTSGTGFFFLRNLVNTRGEDAAFAYFDKLSENILQFTSSGSGPVNALIQGEVGIGLAMTFQAVTTINQGTPLTIRYFDEGSPYNLYGITMIKSKETRKAVRDVFEFYSTILSREDKELYLPEPVFKVQSNTIPNYPKNVKTADMTGIDNNAEKQRLLEKWKY
jgi:iron(III) transport system substrate-binding protein